MSEATTLPTEPQPLPYSQFIPVKCLHDWSHLQNGLAFLLKSMLPLPTFLVFEKVSVKK